MRKRRNYRVFQSRKNWGNKIECAQYSPTAERGLELLPKLGLFEVEFEIGDEFRDFASLLFNLVISLGSSFFDEGACD